MRQSLDRTGQGLAVERQREVCEALCAARGWEVVGSYADNSVSAYSGKARPAYRDMLADVAAGRVDVVVAWKQDRLVRRTRDLLDLADAGVRFVTADGEVDLTTASGRMLGTMLAAVAQGEVETKGERQRLAAAQAARAGKPAGGGRPFGFEPGGLTVRPAEAELIRAGYRSLLAGSSLRAIAATWHLAGARTSRGGRWRPDSVRGVLLRARYAGLRSHRGEVVGPGQWPPLVPEATWRAAVALLSDPGRRTAPDNRRRYPLSGLATCGLCDALVDTGRTQHGTRTYKCSATRHLAVAAAPVEEYVGAVVVARLGRADAAGLLAEQGPDTGGLAEQGMALRARLHELAELYAEGAVTASQLSTATAGIRGRLDEVERASADAGRVRLLGALVGAEDVQAVWGRLDVDTRRAVIAELLSVRLLSPGRGARTFRPATVEIAWRG